jgi:hypothetical protein
LQGKWKYHAAKYIEEVTHNGSFIKAS